MRRAAGMAALLVLMAMPVRADLRSALMTSDIKVMTKEYPEPAVAGTVADSAVVWVYLGPAGLNDRWKPALEEVFKKAFPELKVRMCDYPDDCGGEVSDRFPDDRWVVKIILTGIRSDDRDSWKYFTAEGTVELFDFGRSLKQWDQKTEIAINAPVWGGVTSEMKEQAQVPLARDASRQALEKVLPVIAGRDKGSSAEKKRIFIGNVAGANPEASNAVESALLTVIEEAGDYTAISEADAKAQLNALAFQQMLGCNSDACMIEIGNQLGANNVVYGTVSQVGGDIQIVLNYLDMKGSAPVKRSRRTIPAKLKLVPGAVKSMFKEMAR